MGTRLRAWTVIGKTMKFLSVALISALLATAAAVPAPRVGDCAAADDYIDEVLINVAKMVVEQGYDPAELPGDEVHFSQDIGFITIHGSARYDQGHFDGLSTIHRTGETQLCVGDTIDVHANIGLRDARAGYHVAAEFQGIEVEPVRRQKSTALTSTLRHPWPCLGKADSNWAGSRSPMWDISTSVSAALAPWTGS